VHVKESLFFYISEKNLVNGNAMRMIDKYDLFQLSMIPGCTAMASNETLLVENARSIM